MQIITTTTSAVIGYDERVELTRAELQHFIDSYPRQFEAILNTHDADIIAHWYTIPATDWNSFYEPDYVLSYDRGQVYVSILGSAAVTRCPAVRVPFPTDEDNLDWL